MKHWPLWALACLGLSGCADLKAKPQTPLAPHALYVAMGSSYAAGTSIGGTKPGTPGRCGRSAQSYASLAATWLGLELIDATCGGATTANVLNAWNEVPAQIESVTPETRLVTITIGGNDVGFVRNLMANTCAAASRGCGPVQVVTEADWSRMESGLKEIVHKVQERAPQARIVLVDYVSVLSQRGNCNAMRMTDDALRTVRATSERFAKVTASVARESKVDLLAAGKLSAHHTPCDAVPWSVGAVGPKGSVPWHPNAAGHTAIAQALVRKLVN